MKANCCVKSTKNSRFEHFDSVLVQILSYFKNLKMFDNLCGVSEVVVRQGLRKYSHVQNLKSVGKSFEELQCSLSKPDKQTGGRTDGHSSLDTECPETGMAEKYKGILSLLLQSQRRGYTNVPIRNILYQKSAELPIK